MPRSFVIGDIHGCLKTFRKLVEQINPNSSDQLVLLGDYISKGPNPLGVLQYIIQLKEKLNLVALLGNHDLLLLKYLQSPTSERKELLVSLNNGGLTDLKIGEQNQVRSLLETLTLFYEEERCLCVHAGFDFSLKFPFRDQNSMLNIRDFQYDHLKAKGKIIIHGHNPKNLETVRKSISSQHSIIHLDNGCVYKNLPGFGSLLALELNEMQLYSQKNCD